MNKLLLTLLAGMVIAPNAHAQLGGTDSKPGDTCAAAEEGHIRRNASADRDISEITLICDGTAWQSATGGGGSTVWLNDGPGGPAEVYYNSGNVGIGTNDPSAKLDISETLSTGVADIRFSNAGDGAGYGGELSYVGSSASGFAGDIILRGLNNNTGSLRFRMPNAVGNDFVFEHGAQGRMKIEAVSGKIGIGAAAYAAPKTLLDISGTIKIGDGAELCNSANHEGAIRYVAATDVFQMCRNSGAGWEAIGTSSGGITALTGEVTASGTGSVAATITANAVTNAKMADDAIGIAELSATGTASATTYLRGDNTWATVPSGADDLGNHIATTVLRSDTNNTDDLGTTAVRWKDGWFAGTVTGGTFAGSGASLTALNATNLASGTIPDARLTGNYTGLGTVTATSFVGSGASLTALNATNIASGTIPDARLTGNYTGLGTVTATSFVGSGASLTALNATNLTSGTVAGARLPAYTGDVTKALGGTALTIAAGAVDLTHMSATGTKNSTTFLRGDNTWAVPAGGGGGSNCTAGNSAGFYITGDNCDGASEVAKTFTCPAINHGNAGKCTAGTSIPFGAGTVWANFICNNGTRTQAGFTTLYRASGSCACFAAGSKVLMAGGGVKAIEALAVGDKVLGHGGKINTVLALKPTTLGDRKLYTINGTLKVTADHPALTEKGWGVISRDLYAERYHGKTMEVTLASGEKARWETGMLEPAEMVEFGLGDKIAFGDEGFQEITNLTFEELKADTPLYTAALDGDGTMQLEGGFVFIGLSGKMAKSDGATGATH